MFTKQLSGDEVSKHFERSNFKAISGRFSKSLAISGLNHDHEGDHWTRDDQCVVRVHIELRRDLCNPYRYRGAPKMLSFTSIRVTHGVLKDVAGCTKQGNWICKGSKDFDVGQWWIGRRVFIPKVDQLNPSKFSRGKVSGGLCSLAHAPNEHHSDEADTVAMTQSASDSNSIANHSTS